MASIDTQRLARIKAHMHVDHDDDDAIIMEDAESAIEYLESLSICETANTTKRYWRLVAAITLYWYDMPAGGDPYDFPRGVIQLKNQLKMECGGMNIV